MEPNRVVQLPNVKHPTAIDPDVVACVRVDTNEPIVIIHTSQGFAIPVIPDDDTSVKELFEVVMVTLGF